MIYKARDLKNHLNTVSGYKNGIDVPVRPVPLYGWRGLKVRIKGALLVLKNKGDVVTW
uniref:Uncharacterized protein n=1 Tax=Pantoea phage Survivor TaxID=3232176 RepID=A0AAU8KZG2_9CAUD